MKCITFQSDNSEMHVFSFYHTISKCIFWKAIEIIQLEFLDYIHKKKIQDLLHNDNLKQ